MTKPKKAWSAEEHRRYLETLLSEISHIVSASGKPLLAFSLLADILAGHPSKLVQLLAKLW
jgi:hypothetical protein